MDMPDTEYDLRSRMNAVEHQITAVLPRLQTLEQWQRQSEIAGARDGERWKNVDKRFDDLDKKIEKVSGVLTKIMWLIISGLVVAIMGFIVGGGLKLI